MCCAVGGIVAGAAYGRELLEMSGNATWCRDALSTARTGPEFTGLDMHVTLHSV